MNPAERMVTQRYRDKAVNLRQLIFVVLIALSMPIAVEAQDYSSDVNWLIEVLELKEGAVVADIGAGDGDQTLEIARYIGPEGHIYSTELGSESLQELRGEISSASPGNVTVLEGHPARTNLPAECCDAIYMRRVYHHFGDPPSMNASLLRSLKPGGRLAIIDFEPRGSEADPGARASGRQHGVTAETVVKELTKAGFILVSNDDRPGRNFYLVLEKPEDS
ncbi:methyltransferase domain-containing protein [Aliifodinibius sp. S!AR15-10]|uniref:methyltransferase domain-containing protein n=1 Tax=Aliifodinibius sp. S!AR15-10 TaxID=2950437 RepID=UPI00286162D5|nr:methyltransferase domain-containing protein [Aliifodinibius sp. S!AR15-10]MDR8393459.1 methyltransferase domain-containing protein [Aliifodinibius sp. S!AR15-10]